MVTRFYYKTNNKSDKDYYNNNLNNLKLSKN